jgi:hypothetical protein
MFFTLNIPKSGPRSGHALGAAGVHEAPLRHFRHGEFHSAEILGKSSGNKLETYRKMWKTWVPWEHDLEMAGVWHRLVKVGG